MKSKNPYTFLGLGLVLTGAWLAPVSHILLHSTPLSALGLSLIILGAVCLVLGGTRPQIPPEISTILLETSLENISAIVEELGLRTKAVYLPSSLTNGEPRALIPLHSNLSLPLVKGDFPRRLITKYGPGAEDIGLLITTPGSATVKMLEAKPGSTSSELEATLTSIFIGALDIAGIVRVNMTDQTTTIEVSNPRLEYRNLPFYQCLGSPLASIAAAIVAEALGKPIVVEEEVRHKGKTIIELRNLE